MAFLKLCDIGKIYSSENNVAVGIRKVNLSFDKGEFVAVTGKSGSGKTTLLNVIGGLDSYEEGEMYIEGKPTSHYSKSDWDEYVKKYVSFIFQDYNILESFTVIENIEFALTSIKDIKERKRRALEIAERVGLKDRLKTRGAKLSGGEKQRTVIARAIAKGSPIILADEPTGNLDSVNAKSILALLKEVSEEKLVIVVTHNYEDVKEYATRHIRIFDGKIESDEVFEKVSEAEYYKENDEEYEKERQYVFGRRKEKKKLTFQQRCVNARDKFMLGLKRFATRPKQNILILFMLFLALSSIMLSIALVGNTSSAGNYLLNDMEGRVIVAQYGTTAYDETSAEALKEKYGAKKFIMHDHYLDNSVDVILAYQSSKDYKQMRLDLADSKKVDKGRLPQQVNEVALKLPYNFAKDYEIGDEIVLLSNTWDIGGCNQGVGYTVVGIDYCLDNRDPVCVYLTDEGYELYANFLRLGTGRIYGLIIEVDDEGFPVLNGQSSSYIDFNSDDISLVIDASLTGKTVQCSQKVGENEGVYVLALQEAALLFCDVEYVPGLKPLIAGDFDSDNIVLRFSLEKFKEYYTHTSSQISLIFDNAQAAEKAYAELTEDGYMALVAADIQSLSEESLSEKLIEFFSGTLLTLAFSVTITLIIVVTLIKLMILGKKDVSIFRTMGIPYKVVKASTYVQLFLAMIPAVIASAIFIIILYFAPIGDVIAFMGWNSAIMIALGIAVLLLILAAVYNRLIYRQKIRKGLRRANK